jgi:16S rRNA (adenine1518-N6/adenine1519-N6)-dimethyltransferase
MQTRRDIEAILRRLGRRPDKRHGQCFLVDLRFMQALLDTAEPASGQTVLEVGPGTGSLTEELASRAGRVVAVEIDRALAGHLQKTYAADDRVEVLPCDVLASKSEIAPAVLDACRPQAQLTANLPYSIATPLVANLLIESWRSLRETSAVRFDSLCFTVQQEVADRMLARPAGGDSDGGGYGMISVLIGILGRAQAGRAVPAGAFWPRPKIDSRIVRIDFDPARVERLNDIAALQALLHQCFTQRRKHVIAAAKSRSAAFGRDVLSPALADCEIAPTARADELSPDEYLRLANLLSS